MAFSSDLGSDICTFHAHMNELQQRGKREYRLIKTWRFSNCYMSGSYRDILLIFGMCWGHRVLSHTFSVFFLKIFPDFENISRNQFLVEKYQDLEIFRFRKFWDRSFLCQAFLCLWPDFRVFRLLIWFSAVFGRKWTNMTSVWPL